MGPGFESLEVHHKNKNTIANAMVFLFLCPILYDSEPAQVLCTCQMCGGFQSAQSKPCRTLRVQNLWRHPAYDSLSLPYEILRLATLAQDDNVAPAQVL